MTSLETLLPRLSLLLCALAAPALALAQASARPRRIPPGGMASAWPLGLIVLLVLLVAVLGAYLARRRGHSSGEGPTPHAR